MANEMRKAGLYGVVGALAATLIIVGILMSGLRLPTFVPSTGTLIIKLTDAPVNLKHLNITIDSVAVQRVEDGTETWVNLTFIDDVSEVYFDLLALENVTMDLSVTEVPPGNYTMIKMHVKTANATYTDGGWDDLRVPSEAIKVIVHFEIENGGVRTVLVDMEAEWVAISQSKNLRPVLKAKVVS